MKKFILLVCILGICMTGCNSEEDYPENENKEEEMEERVELTKEQEWLLCKISIDEDAVKEGRLASWQKEVINQYNYAMDYLKRKYPSYSFQITNCDPKNKLNSYTTIGFIEKSDEEGYYEIYMDVEEREDGNRYIAEDNFYGSIKEDEYAEKMSELLRENFDEWNIEVECNMGCVEGEEFGENLDLDRLINGELRGYPSSIFVIPTDPMDESEYQRIYNELKEFIQERGIAGAYRVKFVNKENREELLYTNHFFGD